MCLLFVAKRSCVVFIAIVVCLAGYVRLAVANSSTRFHTHGAFCRIRVGCYLCRLFLVSCCCLFPLFLAVSGSSGGVIFFAVGVVWLFVSSRCRCNTTKRPIDLQPFYCLRNVGAAFASIRSTFLVKDDRLLLEPCWLPSPSLCFHYQDPPEVFSSVAIGVFWLFFSFILQELLLLQQR